MPAYRDDLPQLSGDIFLTDGGLETTLIFHDGLELPEFAAFVLLEKEPGRETLRNYFRRYATIATEHGVGFLLESPTWRANPDWGARIGYDGDALARANRGAIRLLEEVRAELETPRSPMVISACVGPRCCGYGPKDLMTADEAERYHTTQLRTLSATEADLVSAMTMAYADEAIGITRAAQSVGLPIVISFTVETDGRLPTGVTLQEAIETVDAATDGGPAHYMINCAHPIHFQDALAAGTVWTERIRGIRANASTMSHAELDEAEALDDGDPDQLGALYRALRERCPHISLLGGCCGTDHRHVESIATACLDAG